MLVVKGTTAISAKSILGLSRIPLRRIPFSKFKPIPLHNVRFCSTVTTQEIVQPKIKPAYLSLGTDLAKRSRFKRWYYWTGFASILAGGSVVSELLLAQAGAPQFSGASFLGVVGLSSLVQFALLKYRSDVPAAFNAAEASTRGSDGLTVLRHVREVSAIAGLKTVPKAYIIPTDEVNAFACGFTEDTSSVAVTQGLLRAVNDNELRAIIGHEVGHIINGDAATALHLIAINTGFYFAFETAWQSLTRRAGSKKGEFNRFALALAVAGLGSYAVGRLFELWISRSREFVADACAIAFTGNNRDIATALTKIHQVKPVKTIMQDNKRIYAHMYFIGENEDWFSTHPSLKKRLANINQYSESFIRDMQKKNPNLPKPVVHKPYVLEKKPSGPFTYKS